MSKNKKEVILFGIVISGILIASSLLSISGQLIQEVRAQNMTNQITTNATSTRTDMGNATTTPSPSPCCPSNGHIANAGSDQTVLEGTIITLNGSNSNKSSNIENTANYLWRQTAGPSIILNGNNTAHPNFVAPNYPTDTKYTFALEVFEDQVINNNQTGAAIDTVDIMVKDANIEAKNPGTFQGEDDNTEEQSNQNELQDDDEEEGEEEEQSDNDDNEDEDDDEEEEGNEDE
jgi:Tfp pilus assembly protein FimT